MEALTHREDFGKLRQGFFGVIFPVVPGNEHYVLPVPGPFAALVGNSLGFCSKWQEQGEQQERQNGPYETMLHAQEL